MAAYSGQQSKYFSSSGSLDDFQYNNGIPEKSQDTNYVPEINQRIPEIILSDAGNACDNFTLNFKNNKECESALNLGKDEVIYPKCQFDLNGHETKNKNVTPNFNVGGLVSTNYHSQPNLNDIVNNQEETNPTKVIKQPNSYSIHTHPKSGDETHCLHEQINQTDLACFIQDALGERCNVIQVDPSASKINLQSQVYPNSLNVPPYSSGRQFCNPLLGGVVGTPTGTHTGGPSTIVVMMNNNSTQIQPNINQTKQSPSYNFKHQIQRQPAQKKCLQPTNISTEYSMMQTYSSTMPLYEEQNEKHHLSEHESHYGMEGDPESSKGGFKSSFAQEVAENVRNSSTFANKQLNRNFLEPTAINPFTEENYDSRDPFYQHSLASPSSLAGRLNRDEGASLTSGYFDSSSIDCYQDDIFSKDGRSSNKLLDNLTKMPSIGDRPDDASLCSSSSNTWMTSSQFVKLLEMQEAKENTDEIKFNSKGISLGSNKINGHKNRRLYQRINIEENQRPSNAFGSSNLKRINNGVKGSSSYLDKDAQFPFGKLKKTCTDLGFTFSEHEWSQLGNMLSMDTKRLKPLCNEDYSTTHRGMSQDNYTSNVPRVSNSSGQHFEKTPGGEQDITVKNGDFFAALHMLMKNKHSYLSNGGSQQKDDSHKYSMKSDSGGEMESCRSSDSETLNEITSPPVGTRERTLTNPPNQRHSISSEDSAVRNQSPLLVDTHKLQRGSGSVNQRTIDNLTEQLAERDTELLRTRLECQRLNNLVTNVQVKSDNAMDGGPKTQQHKRRNIELEKEVENLKWQLNAMESSRKTYEEATNRLVTFLEQVTTVLQGTSPVQRKLLESTRAEVSKVARRARIQGSQPYLQRAAKRYSLDSASQNSLMSRAESMPGLTSGYGGSLLSLSTSTTEASSAAGENSPLNTSTNKQFSRKYRNDTHPRDTMSARESISSRNSSDFSTGQNYFEKSGYKTLPSSHYASSTNARSASAGKPKQRIKRSQSTSSGGGHGLGTSRHHSLSSGMHSRTQSPMPSLKEQDYPLPAEEETSSLHLNSVTTPTKDRESRKCRATLAYVNNDIINEYAKTSSLKSTIKRLSTSRSKSGSCDQRKIVSTTGGNLIMTSDDMPSQNENTNVSKVSLLDDEFEAGQQKQNYSQSKTKRQNQLKQVIKIGSGAEKGVGSNCNIKEDLDVHQNTLHINDPAIYIDSNGDNPETLPISTKDNANRKYIPRRSASTASISKQSLKQSFKNLEDTKEYLEKDESKNAVENSQNMNIISNRFSLGSGVSRVKGRKSSQSSSRSKDRSVSPPPPPMPIEAVVQVVSPTSKDTDKINICMPTNIKPQHTTLTPLVAEALGNSIQNSNIQEEVCNGSLPKKECTSSVPRNKECSITRQTPVSQTSKNSTIQVLVSSNSNNPAALRSQVRPGTDLGSAPLLKDQTKFKSLGDLHMEKGLPLAPRVLPSPESKTKEHIANDPDDPNGASSSPVVRERLANNAHKLLRSMKQLLAREKTVNITGSGSSSCSSQIAGGGNKTGVVITSSKPTDNTTTYKHHLNNQSSKKSNQGQSNFVKSSSKTKCSNISKVNISNDVSEQEVTVAPYKQTEQMQITQAFPYDARVNLQLLSTMSFPGLPSYPVLAASKSSPWNC